MAGVSEEELAIFFQGHASILWEYEKKGARNDQYISAVNCKEWGMIALSTVFICLAVWMDLKTPEYLSDITTLLAKDGTKVSDIMDPGSKMLLFSLEAFLMAVFVGFFGFKSRCQLYDATSRRDFPSSDGLLWCRDQEILVPSLLTRTTNDLTQLQIMIVMGMQVVTRGPIMAIWALTKIWGKKQCLDNVCWDCGLDGLDFSLFWFLLPFRASKRFKVWPMLWMRRHGRFDWGASGSRLQCRSLSKWEIPGWKQGLNRLNLFVYRLMSLMNPVMTVVSSGLTLLSTGLGRTWSMISPCQKILQRSSPVLH